jgi:hypothetical protein
MHNAKLLRIIHIFRSAWRNCAWCIMHCELEKTFYSPAVALHPFCGHLAHQPLSVPLKMSFLNCGGLEQFLLVLLRHGSGGNCSAVQACLWPMVSL